MSENNVESIICLLQIVSSGLCQLQIVLIEFYPERTRNEALDNVDMCLYRVSFQGLFTWMEIIIDGEQCPAENYSRR